MSLLLNIFQISNILNSIVLEVKALSDNITIVNAKKSVSFNEIHFQLRMRKLIVIRILNIVKKVSAYIYVYPKKHVLENISVAQYN